MKRVLKTLFFIAAIAAGLVLAIASGSKAVARILEIPLEIGSEPSASLSGVLPQAIIVLTGPSDWSRALARVSHAAELNRQNGIPIMICGNGASVLEQVLRDKHGIRSKWLEIDSTNTLENARFCVPILLRESVSHAFLVTDEYHMWRARTAFEWNGLKVIPAPSSVLSDKPIMLPDFLPSDEGRERIRIALHELAGIVWYMIRQ